MTYDESFQGELGLTLTPMLRDGPFRPQVHIAIRYDSKYDDLADE